MNKNEDNGKYVLQNKLRTWSELEIERALAAGLSPTSTRRKTSVPERRWSQPLRQPSNPQAVDDDPRRTEGHIEDQLLPGTLPAAAPVSSSDSLPILAGAGSPRWDDGRGYQGDSLTLRWVGDHSAGGTTHRSSRSGEGRPRLSFAKNTMARPDRCQSHSGRDFGGSLSGVGSRASSPGFDRSSEGHRSPSPKHVQPILSRTASNKLVGKTDEPHQRRQLGLITNADALGDHQRAEDAGIQSDDEGDNMSETKVWDPSIEESIY